MSKKDSAAHHAQLVTDWACTLAAIDQTGIQHLQWPEHMTRNGLGANGDCHYIWRATKTTLRRKTGNMLKGMHTIPSLLLHHRPCPSLKHAKCMYGHFSCNWMLQSNPLLVFQMQHKGLLNSGHCGLTYPSALVVYASITHRCS